VSTPEPAAGSTTPAVPSRPVPAGVVTGADDLRLLGLDPARPESRLLVRLCNRYGLDPLLKHVQLIKVRGGTVEPYITRDGLLDIAHRSGVLDGISAEASRGEHGWRASCTVWRKDWSHPVTYNAGCGFQEGKDDPEAMAIARAERRTLKRAFDVAGTGDEDDDADEAEAPSSADAARASSVPAAPDPETSAGTPPAPPTPADYELDHLAATIKALPAGVRDQLGAWWSAPPPLPRVRELDADQYAAVLEWLAHPPAEGTALEDDERPF